MSTLFTTLDVYLASFLKLKGFNPKLTLQDDKVLFVFPNSEELFEEISNYSKGAQVDANRFATTIKTLKSQIFSMIRERNAKKM